MPKLTVHEDLNTVDVTEKKKPQKETITDSKGRVITLRELDPLQQSRIVMAVGGEVATNSTYMNGFALPAAMVAKIDDDFFGFPNSVKQIDSMLKILGSEGMAAINGHMLAKFEKIKEEVEKEIESAEKLAAKN
ncbi:hypothetical protein [Acinetobacter sp. ANC 4640]